MDIFLGVLALGEPVKETLIEDSTFVANHRSSQEEANFELISTSRGDLDSYYPHHACLTFHIIVIHIS